jgi:hypothetical protein
MGAALVKIALYASRLHWLLDMVFRDDASKIKLASARQNWVRHFTLILLRRPGAGTGSVEIKRFETAFEPDDLLTLR